MPLLFLLSEDGGQGTDTSLHRLPDRQDDINERYECLLFIASENAGEGTKRQRNIDRYRLTGRHIQTDRQTYTDRQTQRQTG